MLYPLTVPRLIPLHVPAEKVRKDRYIDKKTLKLPIIMQALPSHLPSNLLKFYHLLTCICYVKKL